MKNLLLKFVDGREKIVELGSDIYTLVGIESKCNELREFYKNELSSIELVLHSKNDTFEKTKGDFKDTMPGINAKKAVIEMLGVKVNHPRVQEELTCLIDKNYAELYIAKQISDYLKSKGYYYVIGTELNNLYICYLLGITDINPLDVNNPLLYEFAFLHSSKSLTFEFKVPTKALSQVRQYINDLSKGYAVTEVARKDDGSYMTLEHSQLIPLKDNLNLKKDRSELDDNDYIRVSTLPIYYLDDLSNFIQKHGMPQYPVENNKYIMEDFFFNNFRGVSSMKGSGIGKYLEMCSYDIHSFDTIVYLNAGIHGTGVIDHFKVHKITQGIINKYPTSREKLFYLVLELGLSKEKALRLIDFMKRGMQYRYHHFEEWDGIVSRLPIDLAHYLMHVDYMFPLAYALVYTKISFLEMYYKYNAPEFYSVKMHDFFEN